MKTIGNQLLLLLASYVYEYDPISLLYRAGYTKFMIIIF